jgi:hypothetical protein
VSDAPVSLVDFVGATIRTYAPVGVVALFLISAGVAAARAIEAHQRRQLRAVAQTFVWTAEMLYGGPRSARRASSRNYPWRELGPDPGPPPPAPAPR